jgi:endonuclease YncB( thermonuclease family)
MPKMTEAQTEAYLRHRLSKFRNAGILDIETMGLERGSPIHEVAYAIPGERRAYQYIINKDLRYAVVKSGIEQDSLKMGVSATDTVKTLPLRRALGRDVIWSDLIRVHALMREGALDAGIVSEGQGGVQKLRELLGRGKVASKDELLSWRRTDAQGKQFGPTVRQILEKNDKWLLDRLDENAYPWLTWGRQGLDLEWGRPAGRELKNWSITQSAASIEEVFGNRQSELLQNMSKRITWIHNAPFESTQVGAWLRVAEAQGKPHDGLQKSVAWRTIKGKEDLYVTGPEVNRARTRASLTGDWTGVWKAYMKHSGAGDVRDIMDVLKANQSYGRQLGLIQGGREGNFHGLSVDIATKLFRLVDNKTLKHETHVALLDAARDESYLVHRATTLAQTLDEVATGTEAGKEMLRLARGKKGPLWQAIMYFAGLDEITKDQQQVNLQQRLSKAMQDIAQEDVTMQTDGRRVIGVTMQSNTGKAARSSVTAGKRVGISSISDLVEHIQKSGHYGSVDVQATAGGFLDKMVEAGGLRRTASGFEVAEAETLRVAARQYEEMYVDKRLTAAINRAAGRINGEVLDGSLHIGARKSAVAKMFDKAGSKRAAAIAGGVFASLAVVGLMSKPFQMKRKTPSVRAMDYELWLKNQREFSGQEDFRGSAGMSEGGYAAGMRPHMTDFGSPYRGPWISNRVFASQELQKERERFERDKFSTLHFDPNYGVFSKIKTLMPQRRTTKLLATGVERADLSEYSGIQGNGLFQVDLSDKGWQMKVDDADTITIERGLLFKDRYSFRLSGIDAPEVRHGQQEGQPGSEEATRKLQALLRGKDAKIVFNPTDVTYGRAVGVLFAGGKNLNLELVKTGKVAALDFRSGNVPLLNPAIAAGMENRAAGADMGMWGEPYWQAYEDTLKGKQLTFNQMAKMSKVATNATMMSAVSLMKQAQAEGFYNTAHQVAAADIGAAVSQFGVKEDYKYPWKADMRNAPHNNYMLEMQSDLGTMIKTKGSRVEYKHKHRQGMRKLNHSLALDTMGTSTSSWSKRRPATFDHYGATRRKRAMGEMQREMNHAMFASPINHYRW